MARFEFEDFDPYSVTEPRRERRFGGVSLCAGCKHAHLYRRRDQLDPAVYCHELGKYVPPDIVECSQFSAVADRPANRPAPGGSATRLSLRLGQVARPSRVQAGSRRVVDGSSLRRELTQPIPP